jgi:putative transcriptional regulator
VSSDLAPALLVAMDSVVDPNFRRTVVLMLHHEEEDGALGLILNRPTDFPVADLCENLEIPWLHDRGARVDWGGPVQPDEGWVVFGGEPPLGVLLESIGSDLHWSRSQEALRRVASDGAVRARVFLGYAGWAPGQLEQEIAQGSWLVVPVSARLVFEESHARLWEQAVRSLGIDPATLVATQGVN